METDIYNARRKTKAWWEEGIKEDLRIMKINNWIIQERVKGKKVVEETKTLK